MRALLVVLLSLLASCANVSSDYKFDPQHPAGLVVGTITYESGLGSYRIIVVPTNPEKSGAKKLYLLQAGDSQWSPFSRKFDDDLKRDGSTFAVEMPAGKYVIKAWEVGQGPRISKCTSSIDIPFEVEAGKAIYLGSFNWDEDWENITLTNQSERDIPVLKSRFAVLKASPLTMSIAPNTKLEKLGGGYRYSYEIPIFIPVGR